MAPKPVHPARDNLRLFPQMPIDILLEVLGHLHPMQLMQVSRANKAFRGLLHGPVSPALWRAAFVRHPPIPMCPPDLPPRRWAALLFGPRQCEGCGELNTFPDYRIYRQLCTQCMNLKLSTGVPNYAPSHEVHALVVKTFRTDGSRGDTESEVGRLWPAEGTAVAATYEALLRADDVRALDAFIEARKRIVQAVNDLADEIEQWLCSIMDAAYPLWEATQRRVIKSARRRLIQEGHDERDVKFAQGFWQVSSLDHIARLTSKRWHKARPHVLPLVDDARTQRLVRERAELVTARSAAALTAVSHVLRTAPPATWAYTPPAYTLETFAPLRALLEDPSSTPLLDTDARLADALVGLPAFVEAWRAEKRALLAALLPGAADPPDVRTLELATSVFTCLGSWIGGTAVTAGRTLIGWDGAGAHMRCRSLQRFWEGRVHYAPEGAAAARALVLLMGRDPATATAAEMDLLCGGGTGAGGEGEGEGAAEKGKEKRFLCAVCPVERHKRIRGRRAMRWRECVLHTIERTRMRDGDEAHGAPAWVLLTDAGADDVRRRERPDPVALDSAWVCALCTAHYESRVTLPTAIQHVHERHSIATPLEGVHYLYIMGAERTPRVPALLSLEGDVAEYRCNRCPQRKLWSLRTVRSHVLDKHGVATPGESDWTLVERIARSTLDLAAPDG